MYTQVIESLPVLELPHPNPPLAKGSHCVAGVPPVVASGVRELDFLVSPLVKGGLRGVKPGSQNNSDLCVHRSPVGEGLGVRVKPRNQTGFTLS
ncbi:hypothetical protein NIES37_63570 [Tolypothrix tenuis PCC 7101]|uniref:Uncharacterized protein n=1 Tax=Tolypothrix tenuis PCC 7101 TaxID=231146 RepID=A0A1Z4N9G9_9CYAN|nr:hypothetical protein NIES37_63570 [Tolypothrix tenuis PCC 7101]BAZ73734.1 hypothetical protein NIES50_23000 [Aulosira laxa NIES-50]